MGSLLTGCGNETIRTYRIPKEKPFLARESSEMPSPPQVQWQTPSGWKEEPGGGMRVARFSVTGTNGQAAEVSIIPLPGISASKKDIVNLWREQVHLPPVQDDDLLGQSEKVEMGPGSAELFDMVSTEPVIQDKSKMRILVAMLSQRGTMWFFKMTGEDSLVQEQKPVFVGFLKSINLEPARSSPRELVSQTAPEPSPVGAEETPSKPQWEVPPDWKEQPPGQMLLAKFLLTGGADAKAEVTVSVFPGDTGGLLANVNRWRGQVGLGPLEASQLNKHVTSLDVPGGKATLVDVSGTSPRTGQKARLIGAILPRAGRTWFYKLLGDEAVAAQQQSAFIKFIKSVRYPDAP
jgi:hypothetical protein